MADSYVPGLVQSTIAVPGALEAGGNALSQPVTIKQRALTDDTIFVVGRLCHVDADDKLHPLADAETAVIIEAAAGDIILDDVGTDAPTVYDLTLATPPIPGSVTIVTTATGSVTPVLSIGPDNGAGLAESAAGHFTIDYESGRVRIVYAVAPTNNHDIKAAYSHRILDAVPANQAGRGLPKFILAQDTLGATAIAGDVKSVAYNKGRFRAASLLGYSAGYEAHLRALGIFIQS